MNNSRNYNALCACIDDIQQTEAMAHCMAQILTQLGSTIPDNSYIELDEQSIIGLGQIFQAIRNQISKEVDTLETIAGKIEVGNE